RQPFFVDVRTQSAILDPHVDFRDVLRHSPGDLQDLANRGKHLRALRLDAFRIFPRVRFLAGHAAGNQKGSDAARRRNGIIVLEAWYFDADASAHPFASLYNSRSMGPLA